MPSAKLDNSDGENNLSKKKEKYSSIFKTKVALSANGRSKL